MAEFKNLITLTQVLDGAQGQPGAPGKDAQKYKIETNQDEILKFFSAEEEETQIFSPNVLSISIYEITPEEEAGQRKINIGSDLSGFKFSVYDKQWKDFIIPENSNDLIYSSIENGSLILYFNALSQYKVNEEKLNSGTEKEETDDAYTLRVEKEKNIYSICSSLTENDVVLKIEYKIQQEDGKIYLSEKLITIRHAMTQDMAKLALKADGIYASIASAALEFTADGLSVRNGGLTIKNNSDITVFGADTDGNLEISGIIHASDGEFTGTITANSGTIGGFEISKHEIKSDGLSLQSSYTDENKKPVPSKIVADNIEIGTGAIIRDYINLGDKVQLRTPNDDNKNFIEVKPNSEDGTNNNQPYSIQMDNTGKIILGNNAIILDGAEQTISGQNWNIQPDLATFNNIIVNGSIKAASFEYGEISSVGGVIFVRPSSRIAEIKEGKARLESVKGFSPEDYCRVGESYFTVKEIEANYLTFNEDISALEAGNTIVNMGKKGTVGIGINGSDDVLFGLESNAITVNEFDIQGDIKRLVPKLILGKLPNDYVGNNSTTYGLYADNVILNGQLTTRTDASKNIYSGIGTKIYENAPSTSNMTDYFPDVELDGKIIETPRGQILMWAGAKDKNDIENAKFFVDEYGNMYAGSAYFKGTIITDSIIKAAEIQTAILTGAGKSEPALAIKNVTEGIHFIKEDETETKAVFRVSSEEFDIDGLKANLNAVYSDTGTLIAGLEITQNGVVTAPFINLGDLVIEKTYVRHRNNNTKIDFIDNEEETSLNLKINEISKMFINTSGTSINGNLFYTDGAEVKGEYRQITDENQIVIGYDLYIY